VLGSPFGFTVPFRVAPDVEMPVAPVVVTVGVAAVVKHVTDPYVVPELFVASACTQYVVPGASPLRDADSAVGVEPVMGDDEAGTVEAPTQFASDNDVE
jgi:hypothetical protein